MLSQVIERVLAITVVMTIVINESIMVLSIAMRLKLELAIVVLMIVLMTVVLMILVVQEVLKPSGLLLVLPGHTINMEQGAERCFMTLS